MAELTKSNVVTTVFGDMRIVTFEVSATTSGHIVSGLDYIHWAGAENEDTTGVTVQLLKNSSDGTANSLNGAIYLILSAGTDTMSVIAIGK